MIFDFITDEAFRASLETDHKEMLGCRETAAWKSVHVLAGSIIEAVLIDHLIAEGHVARESALKMDLGNAIELARGHRIISDRSAALSTVIKDYRNLIHPGRAIRTSETVSRSSADVASSLVEIILDEIEKRKRSNYGYTAEQLVAKVERDSSAEAILPHLLKEVNAVEIERLLIKVLPDRYLSISVRDDPFDHLPAHVLPGFIALFRGALDIATDPVKVKVAKRFVTILKEEADTIVFSYGTAFFRLSDLCHVSPDEALLVKEHYFGRLKDGVTRELIIALDGIGTYLKNEEVLRFVDPLVRAICFGQSGDVKGYARDRLSDEYMRMGGNRIVTRFDDWSNMFRSRGNEEMATVVEDLKASMDIPF